MDLVEWDYSSGSVESVMEISTKGVRDLWENVEKTLTVWKWDDGSKLQVSGTS